jgi:carbon-monoxide dehydrogenase medium subunit
MYPASFEYHRASSVDDAIALLGRYGEDAKLLAGGHSLIPVMKLRFAAPAHLVDISRIVSLAGIAESGGNLVIGALTRHADVAASALVRAKAGLLAEAAGEIGDPQVRNAGTIGGSLAHADPAADLPAAMLALGATMIVTGKGGQRRVEADAFFRDVFQTALGAAEILTAVEVPIAGAGSGGAYEKHPDPASGYAIVGVAAQLSVAGGKVAGARVAMTGLGAKPMRLTAIEAALTGQAAGAGSIDAASAAAGGLAFGDDSRGSAAYKANLARVFAKRALTRALARAMG